MPAADGEPNSPASCRGQHQSTHGPALPGRAVEAEAFAPCCNASASIRRTARRAAKPIPAIQSAAEAPRTAEGWPLTSCSEFVSSPRGRRSSQAGQPSAQVNRRPNRDEAAFSRTDATAPRRGACRSRCKMRERRFSITASLPGGKAGHAAERLGSKQEPHGKEVRLGNAFSDTQKMFCVCSTTRPAASQG